MLHQRPRIKAREMVIDYVSPVCHMVHARCDHPRLGHCATRAPRHPPARLLAPAAAALAPRARPATSGVQRGRVRHPGGGACVLRPRRLLLPSWVAWSPGAQPGSALLAASARSPRPCATAPHAVERARARGRAAQRPAGGAGSHSRWRRSRRGARRARARRPARLRLRCGPLHQHGAACARPRARHTPPGHTKAPGLGGEGGARGRGRACAASVRACATRRDELAPLPASPRTRAPSAHSHPPPDSLRPRPPGAAPCARDWPPVPGVRHSAGSASGCSFSARRP